VIKFFSQSSPVWLRNYSRSLISSDASHSADTLLSIPSYVNIAPLTVHSLSERLRSLAAKPVRPLARQSPPVLPPKNRPVMSNHSTIDREAFQKFLESAFAVQQSQIDSQSLSAIVEVGRLIRSGELDVDGAVDLIVDRTRKVADTAGVAIGPLSGAQLPLLELNEDDRSSGAFLSHLAITLSACGTGAVSADVALDRALNDIAEQARMMTKAGTAAITLMRGEEMVCCATAGKSAPELGELLNARAGLSTECIQTKETQYCADTEADSRVDAGACRRLGIRSLLAFPMLKQGELLGLFEVFSPTTKAFGDRDVQTLQDLSQQALINVDRAAELSSPPPAEDLSTTADNMDGRLATLRIRPVEVKTAQVRLSGPWTPLLLILVIALASLAGWMLGRDMGQGTANKKGPPALVSAKPNVAPPQPEETRQAEPSPPPVPPKARSPETPSDGLVVYQNGKVIFRVKPSQAHGASSAPDPALVFPREASVRPLQQVQPEYPEAAKQQHIQGTVGLEAKVGKDGAVQQLAVISGNPMLATAASDAVLKWRFKPLVQNSRAVPFQTRIKVDFVLP
jgi:TonB family protein